MNKVINFIKKHYPIFVLGIVIFLFVTFASECSFLYRTNEWDDVHCYHTVGWAMSNGKILYRDIHEQKGPYLYFLHVLAVLIAPGKYYGMYIFELLLGWTFAYAMYKIMSLFVNNKQYCTLSTVLILVLYYISFAFNKGDSAEELVIPFYALSLYLVIQMAQGKKDICILKTFIIGLLAGIVLLTKFTLIAFYGGIMVMILVLFIKKKNTKMVWLSIASFVGGFILAWIPVLIYFGVNNAFNDFFTIYFYNNIFHYTTDGGGGLAATLAKMAEAWYVRFAFGYSYFLFILFGFFYILFNKRIKKDIVFWSALIPYIFMNLMITVGGASYNYYGLPNAIYAFVGVYALYDLITHKEKSKEHVKRHQKPYQIAILSVLSVISFVGTPNLPRMFVSENDIMEYQMKAIIEKEDNPTLLNYGCLDVGVYYLCGIMPTTKYFAGYNGHYDELEKEQQRIVDDCEVMFVIARVDRLPANIDLHYDLVYTGQLHDIDRQFKYNLYKYNSLK